MQYRQLGRVRPAGLHLHPGHDGLRRHRLGHARSGQIGVDGAREQIAIARDAGVNLIDTADVYSAGLAEEILGEALGGDRDEVLIATKARMPMGDGPNDAGLSRHHIIRAAEASLRRLKTDYIDLYQVHEWDGQTPLEETLTAPGRPGPQRQGALRRRLELRRLAPDEGAGHLRAPGGWSGSSASRSTTRCRTGTPRPSSCRLSIDQGLGILVWSPLAGGLLSGKYRRGVEAPAGSRHLSEWDEPPVNDEDKLYDTIETAVEDRRGARGLGGAGVAGLAAGQAGGDLADRRRPHDRAAARQPRRGRPASSSAGRDRRGWTRSAASRCATRTGTRPRRAPTA